jgi:hypothetical protein
VSDFEKFLKRTAGSKAVRKAEAGERAEGVRDALKAGRGKIAVGAKKLHMQKEGLGKQLARAKKMRKK